MCGRQRLSWVLPFASTQSLLVSVGKNCLRVLFPRHPTRTQHDRYMEANPCLVGKWSQLQDVRPTLIIQRFSRKPLIVVDIFDKDCAHFSNRAICLVAANCSTQPSRATPPKHSSLPLILNYLISTYLLERMVERVQCETTWEFPLKLMMPTRGVFKRNDTADSLASNSSTHPSRRYRGTASAKFQSCSISNRFLTSFPTHRVTTKPGVAAIATLSVRA